MANNDFDNNSNENEKEAVNKKITKSTTRRKKSTKAPKRANISDKKELQGVIQHLLDSVEELKNDIKPDDEPKNSLPSEVFVIPITGRPIMPSQITPAQVSSEWEDSIIKISKSSHRYFAIFGLNDKALKGKDNNSINLKRDDFKATGCLVRLIHAKGSDSEIHFVCEGIARVKIDHWVDFENQLLAKVSYPSTEITTLDSKEQLEQKEVDIKAYTMALIASLQELLPLNPLYSEEMKQYLLRFNQNDPSLLADCSASITTANPAELQEVLDTVDILPRLKLSLRLVKRELKAAKLQNKIKGSVSDKLTKRQHDYFLREQLSEIQKELGIKNDEKSLDVAEFEKRVKKLQMPENILKRYKNELQKLQVLEPSSAEYGVARNYLDIITTIPFGKISKENIDLKKARAILDEDHEGLLDVKDRIIEFLAVGALKGQTKGSIILLVGPPGVGKTSIGKSIARALGRPFFRLSLGGVDDESVIKGHRKTYVGAMPGKIIQALRDSNCMNPVIMLDEIDKLSKSYQGDPSASLLETLDPEQNNSFMDHYIDEKIDLSNCLFICTANTTDTIAQALLDRMEPIRLSGYITKEKLAIAKNHLIVKALKNANMKKSSLKLSDETICKIIDEYARESGVRSLERAINKIIRKVAVELVNGKKTVSVNDNNLEKFLGQAPFKKERAILGVGVVTGLAWTSVGGATLAIESSLINREAKGLSLTGSLGDVMKESANIAYSFIQANSKKYLGNKGKDFFKNATIHLHVPEGATPKDGPSAGITMASSLLSLAMNKKPKDNFAMTGELSLTGQVLAIGGIKEKILAARRMGIFNLIVPDANRGDVQELPAEVVEGINFYYANTFDDVVLSLFGDKIF